MQCQCLRCRKTNNNSNSKVNQCLDDVVKLIVDKECRDSNHDNGNVPELIMFLPLDGKFTQTTNQDGAINIEADGIFVVTKFDSNKKDQDRASSSAKYGPIDSEIFNIKTSSETTQPSTRNIAFDMYQPSDCKHGGACVSKPSKSEPKFSSPNIALAKSVRSIDSIQTTSTFKSIVTGEDPKGKSKIPVRVEPGTKKPCQLRPCTFTTCNVKAQMLHAEISCQTELPRDVSSMSKATSVGQFNSDPSRVDEKQKHSSQDHCICSNCNAMSEQNHKSIEDTVSKSTMSSRQSADTRSRQSADTRSKQSADTRSTQSAETNSDNDVETIYTQQRERCCMCHNSSQTEDTSRIICAAMPRMNFCPNFNPWSGGGAGGSIGSGSGFPGFNPNMQRCFAPNMNSNFNNNWFQQRR